MTRNSGRGLFTPRWALLIAGLAALLVLLVRLGDTTEGFGTFIVPSAAKIHISYTGACGPLKLNTMITDTESITVTQQKPIDVGSGTGMIAGCIGTQTDPGTVQIDSELFDYQNLSTYTTENGGVLPQASLPFTLFVDSTSMTAPPTQVAFPAMGFLYVGGERMHYNARTAISFNIDTRTNPAATHPSRSFVRAEGKLILVGRRQPTQNSGWNPANSGLPPGATDPQKHNASVALVGDPVTNLTCRGRFDQTVVAGPDPVKLRYRCYTRLKDANAWPDVDYTTPPYTTSPADPSTGPPLALAPVPLYHGTASGTLNEATGFLTLTTEVFGLTCIPYVPGHLWVRITQVIQLDKNAVNTDSGTFSISAYDNDQCAGTALAVLSDPSADYIATDGPPGTGATYDTDKDGCSDYRELGAGNPITGANDGGQRDPFNPFDYSDVNHDGFITIPVDVLQIAQTYGTPAKYVDYKDRGVKVPDGVDGIDDPANPLDGDGPRGWNKRAPNGSIDVINDVLGAAQQFGHSCPHTHGSISPFGAHPVTLTFAMSSASTPPYILITVGTTAGFPSAGLLLIDSETLTYNQSAGGACTGINVLTQFCITGRGSGSPAGNSPAQHNVGGIVYQKP